MNYLQRRPLGAVVGRTGEQVIEPFIKFYENMVCIINEHAGSGGDKFPYYFRELGLGPLIGNRTWGGLLSITATDRPLIDGGRMSTPMLRFRALSGAWAVENEGVAPDIPIDDHPDKVRKGFDPQLEKAIEVILEKLPER
jgi:tricorn protease